MAAGRIIEEKDVSVSYVNNRETAGLIGSHVGGWTGGGKKKERTVHKE